MGSFRKRPKARKGKNRGKVKKRLVECQQVAGQHTSLTDRALCLITGVSYSVIKCNCYLLWGCLLYSVCICEK